MLPPDSTADTAVPLPRANRELASTMCTSAAIMVTAVLLGLGHPARMAKTPVQFVKMSSLPRIIDGNLGDGDGRVFSNTFFVFR